MPDETTTATAPAPVTGMEVGGYMWRQLEEQMLSSAAQIRLQMLLEQGVNERDAKRIVQQEKDRQLESDIALGMIGGTPTLDARVKKWVASGYMDDGTTPTLAREEMQNSNALDYLKLLASQKGPENWLTYWNTLRNAKGTNLPAYAQALASGQKIAPFGSTVAATNGSNSYQNQTVMPGITYGATGNGMDYNAALTQARTQLVALGGAAWQNATPEQVVAEIRKNNTLFTGNNPIRNALLGTNTSAANNASGGTSYADALNQARSQLVALGGAMWQSATPEQVVAEIKKNQSLFTGNNPIRTALMGGQQFATNTNQTAATNNTLPSGWQQVIQNMAQQNQGTKTGLMPGDPGYAESMMVSANKVRPDQWNNMTDTEQKGWLEGVAQAGGDPTDWQQFMKRSWSQGMAKGQSTFGY